MAFLGLHPFCYLAIVIFLGYCEGFVHSSKWFLATPQADGPTFTSVSLSLLESPESLYDPVAKATQSKTTTIIPPNGSFQTTSDGELSISSFNALAPSYNVLAISNPFQKRDKRKRAKDKIVKQSESDEQQQHQDDDDTGDADDADSDDDDDDEEDGEPESGDPPQEVQPNLQEQVTNFLAEDRAIRYPAAIEMAKGVNADVLCLQEVEGGVEFEPTLQKLLQQPTSAAVPGYDSFVFTNMLPNRPGHVVGLCIAWRSQRHRLVASEEFKRGMVVQLEEILQGSEVGNSQHDANDDSSTSSTEIGATFCVANVHLPARPSNILGRLKTMSTTVSKLGALDQKRIAMPADEANGKSNAKKENALDGLLVVAGDFNSDQKSVAAQLLTKGTMDYGKVFDRNYRASITKTAAYAMKHDYRFQDVYDVASLPDEAANVYTKEENSVRAKFAPVTVSLHGRGPGCMDQIFYTPRRFSTSQSTTDAASRNAAMQSVPRPSTPASSSRRKSRRERNILKAKNRIERKSFIRSPLRVDSVLATVNGADDSDRLAIINAGLPNLEAGFPSDHMPVGVLFAPDPDVEFTTNIAPSKNAKNVPSNLNVMNAKFESALGAGQSEVGVMSGPGGISSHVKRRREAATKSISTRRRHNAILRVMAEWLQSKGATEMLRDQPLYKWPWTAGLTALRKKSRAPDICCVLGSTLIVLEVTITTKPDQVREQKIEKYKDLLDELPRSSVVKDENLQVAETVVIVLDGSGSVPEATYQDLIKLSSLIPESPSKDGNAETEANTLRDHLQYVINELLQISP